MGDAHVFVFNDNAKYKQKKLNFKTTFKEFLDATPDPTPGEFFTPTPTPV
jgi:hypothetical protein